MPAVSSDILRKPRKALRTSHNSVIEAIDEVFRVYENPHVFWTSGRSTAAEATSVLRWPPLDSRSGSSTFPIGTSRDPWIERPSSSCWKLKDLTLSGWHRLALSGPRRAFGPPRFCAERSSLLVSRGAKPWQGRARGPRNRGSGVL